VELVALELEEELSFFESFAPGLEGNPLAAVPDDDAAGAVIPGGNYSFEVAVFERVIFDFYSEPLVGLIVRRAFWDCPATENSVHLEAKVEVEAGCGVFVDDEEISRDWRDCSDRLGGSVRRTFRPICAEAVVAHHPDMIGRNRENR
jgi:hypothetical protein